MAMVRKLIYRPHTRFDGDIEVWHNDNTNKIAERKRMMNSWTHDHNEMKRIECVKW